MKVMKVMVHFSKRFLIGLSLSKNSINNYTKTSDDKVETISSKMSNLNIEDNFKPRNESTIQVDINAWVKSGRPSNLPEFFPPKKAKYGIMCILTLMPLKTVKIC